MSLDERIRLYTTVTTGGDKYELLGQRERDNIKQLIKEVLEYVKPERHKFNGIHEAEFHRDKTIDEMEAKIKELGL